MIPKDCFDASESGVESNIPHVFRYYLARGFIEPNDSVLDVSCGYGYGTKILARSLAKDVTGIDKGEYQLARAVERNDRGNNIDFMRFDLDKPFVLPHVNYIVSIETIEHLEDPASVIKVFKDSAEKMFLTVPIGVTTTHNPYHKHNFTRDGFIKLVQDDVWKLYHSATHGGGVHECFYFKKVKTL